MADDQLFSVILMREMQAATSEADLRVRLKRVLGLDRLLSRAVARDAEVFVATQVKNVLRRELDDREVKAIEGDNNTFSIEYEDGSVFTIVVACIRGPR